MKCLITLVPEDEDDLAHPLVGRWELISVPGATREQVETSVVQAVP